MFACSMLTSSEINVSHTSSIIRICSEMLPPLSDSICTIHTIFCLQIKFTVVHVLKKKKKIKQSSNEEVIVTVF